MGLATCTSTTATSPRLLPAAPPTAPPRRWQAQIQETGGRLVQLGLFERDEDAGRAYDVALLRSGRREKPNFPGPSSTPARG